MYAARTFSSRSGERLLTPPTSFCNSSPWIAPTESLKLSGFGEEFRIFHRGVEGAAQRFDTIGRRVRRGEERGADLGRVDDGGEDRPLLVGLGEFDHGRHVLQVGMLLGRELDDHLHVLVLDPVGMADFERRPRCRVALDLAALDRELRFARAFVAHHQLELGADHVVHRGRINRHGGARAGARRSASVFSASSTLCTFEVFHMKTMLISESMRPTQFSSAVLKRTPCVPSFSSRQSLARRCR